MKQCCIKDMVVTSASFDVDVVVMSNLFKFSFGIECFFTTCALLQLTGDKTTAAIHHDGRTFELAFGFLTANEWH